MTATQIHGFVGTIAGRYEHLKVQSDLSLPANLPSSFSGAAVALLTHHETEADIACSCPCNLDRHRDKAAGGLHEIARPHQVVAAAIVVRLGRAPRD
jgi:hypothetical protein